MHPPNDEELKMFLRIARQIPEFKKFCEKQRTECRNGLEQGAGDLIRGQSITYKEMLSYLQPPTR